MRWAFFLFFLPQMLKRRTSALLPITLSIAVSIGIRKTKLENMYKRLLELLKPNKQRQPILQQCSVSGSCLQNFEKEYKHSHTDGIAFLSKLQHEDWYEILDLYSNQWVKQQYTYLLDSNEQETPSKMIHWFRMGWMRPFNYR